MPQNPNILSYIVVKWLVVEKNDWWWCAFWFCAVAKLATRHRWPISVTSGKTQRDFVNIRGLHQRCKGLLFSYYWV